MSAAVLKLIALFTMVIDHTGAVLNGYSLAAGRPLDAGLYYVMRSVGRAAFMLYAFFIAEGCVKTRDFGKYLFRLGLFALISEVPFDFLFENFKYAAVWRRLTFLETGSQNVFFTLFFGALAAWLWEAKPAGAPFSRLLLSEKALPPRNLRGGIAAAADAAVNFLVSLCPAVLAWLLKTDYGAPGVAFIFLLYLLGRRGRFLQILAVLAFSVYEYWSLDRALWLIAGGWAAALLLAFYSGERGYKAKWFKWFFYAAYPAHLLILAGIFRWVVG